MEFLSASQTDEDDRESRFRKRVNLRLTVSETTGILHLD